MPYGGYPQYPNQQPPQYPPNMGGYGGFQQPPPPVGFQMPGGFSNPNYPQPSQPYYPQVRLVQFY